MFWFPGSLKAMGGVASGSLLGLFINYRSQKKSGIDQWVHELQAANPNAKIHDWGFAKTTKVGLLITVVIILAIIAFGVMAGLTSS